MRIGIRISEDLKLACQPFSTVDSSSMHGRESGALDLYSTFPACNLKAMREVEPLSPGYIRWIQRGYGLLHHPVQSGRFTTKGPNMQIYPYKHAVSGKRVSSALLGFSGWSVELSWQDSPSCTADEKSSFQCRISFHSWSGEIPHTSELAHIPQLLSLLSRACKLQLLSLHATTTEALWA